jgi:polyphosphate kinase
MPRIVVSDGLHAGNRCRASFTESLLTGLSEFHGGRKLILAPFEMRERFLALIAHERDLGSKGRIIVNGSV